MEQYKKMKQPLLITKSKASEYVQVAIGCSEKEFDRYIREAQEFDLKPLVCEEFYYELLNKSTEEPYTDILPGKEYTYKEGTYYHEGLESVLSYFAYARYILKGNVVSTSHGFVTKKTPNSEPISQTEKKDLYYNHRQDANKLFEGVKKYMDRNNIEYNECKDCGPGNLDGDIETRAMKW